MINKVFESDCLPLLKEMKDDSIDMIYLDPPFFTQKTHQLTSRDNKVFNFEDNWESIRAYIEYISIRVTEMRRVLKGTGTIFLHCDRSASHYLRVMLDEIFGAKNFRSEIIWSYKRWSNSKKGLLNNHQNIYLYSKSKQFKFNTLYKDYSATTNLDQILQERVRTKDNKTVYKLDSSGNPVLGKEKQGVPLGDVWDIPYLNPKAKERVGYPTQKPILLLERIINISTDKDDIVLDPFCGSGTTLVAAKLLGRNYIGIDKSKDAIEITMERLTKPLKTESNLLNLGIEKYKTKTDEELKILKSMDAKVVQRNKAIDGFLSQNFENYPVPIRIQKKGESLDSIIELMRSNKKTRESKLKIIVRTESEELLYFPDVPEDFLILDDYKYKVNDFISRKKDMEFKNLGENN